MEPLAGIDDPDPCLCHPHQNFFKGYPFYIFDLTLRKVECMHGTSMSTEVVCKVKMFTSPLKTRLMKSE